MLSREELRKYEASGIIELIAIICAEYDKEKARGLASIVVSYLEQCDLPIEDLLKVKGAVTEMCKMI